MMRGRKHTEERSKNDTVRPAPACLSEICAYVVALGLLVCGCNTEQKQFTRLAADDTGIDFVNVNTETEKVNIFSYEYLYNGGGVAIGDINNDKLPDIYFTANSGENRLYLNRGNLKFKDITGASRTACPEGWKTGVCMADINADGWMDIYVSRSAVSDPKKRTNILLVNNGDLTFTDRSKEYGLDDDSYSTQSAFFDYDRDGDLDVILLNHSLLQISNSFDISGRNTETRFPLVGNRFLRNDEGSFTDISDSVGIFGPASNYGLGISLSDINNDGWIDIYAGCDYTGKDRLLLNDNGRRFHDATDSLLSHISKFTMGTDIADFNGDGLMDICTLDMLPEDNRRQKQLMGSDRYDVYLNMVKNGLHSQYMRNMLHLNNGNGTFSEIGQLAGISNTDWSWAPLFADFDNDGVLDLFVSNGFKRDLTDNDFAKYKVFNEVVAARRQGKQVSFVKVLSRFRENRIPNYIYRGNGDLTFTDMTGAWGLDHPALTNGAAYSDLDNDGDLDLVTSNVNENAGIYRNNADRGKSHYLELQLTGSMKNTGAVGAKVTLLHGGKKMVREVLPVRGFQSVVGHELHFGLGALDAIDSLLIQWPDGETRLLTQVNANQEVALTPRDGQPLTGLQKEVRPLFSRHPDPPAFSHRENDFVDFRIQPLLPRMYSTMGPALAIADVNSDGLQDIFAGGAKGQAAGLFMQQGNGTYIKKEQRAFVKDRMSEDVAAEFFDMDGDGDMDLFVASGGYEFSVGDPHLQDRLYENDGAGLFIRKNFPEYLASSACVEPADIDGDGDVDLFVGGRVVPGRYPETPSSYLLVNNGRGEFAIDVRSASLEKAGMVTDAVWADLNDDGQKDLVVVGEWMPIRVFINAGGRFSDQSEKFNTVRTEGLWNAIVAGDFDGDGDTDLVAGNQGLNTQMKAGGDRPVSLVYGDFDSNGSLDPILNYYVKDKIYPYPSRDELTEQVAAFKKRFTSYSAYSDATIEDVLTPAEMSVSRELSAFELRSCYLQNDSGRFSLRPMPVEFQFAPVFAMTVADVNRDGRPDIISGGNLSATRARTGKLSGNTGFVFLGDGKGNFEALHPLKTGLSLPGDVRHMKLDAGKLIVGINNAPLEVYRLTEDHNIHKPGE